MTSKKVKVLVSSIISVILLALTFVVNSAPNTIISKDGREYLKVTKVIDGDTLEVMVNNKKQSVRLLGINTPETVDPRRPVECFGKEASNKAKSLLTGKYVRLESDDTQDNRDKYDRLLRYVYLEDGVFINKRLLEEGYAYEYTYKYPYKFQIEFKEAQKTAEAEGRGLWNMNMCRRR